MSANRPYDDDDLPPRAYERRADPNRADREISLGTPTILGIFFALTLAFAAVFGIGYSMGHRSGQNAQAAIATDPAGMAVSSALKPNAGLSGPHPNANPVSPQVAPTPADSPAPQTATVPLNPAPAAKSGTTPADSAIVGDRIPPVQPATSNSQPGTTFVVQVAAVSSQDVADIELAALQKKGYSVAVRHEPQDKLLHVQIGPFSNKKEAEAMRARVLADGFNAIVK